MTFNSRKLSVFMMMATLAVFLLISCKNPLVGLGPRVDLTPPDGDVTSVVPGTYVKGIIPLAGTVTDDTIATSVYVRIDGSQPINGTVTGQDWSVEINTNEFGDGDKDIRVYLTDSSGKVSEERLLLIFDNTDPVLLVTAPVGYATSDYTDYSFAIRGEAYDGPYGRVKKVTARVFDSGNYLLDSSIASIAVPVGTSSWSAVFTNSGGNNAHYIEVIAEDYAGNTSTHMYHFDDLYTANANSAVAVEEIFATETQGTDISADLSAAELGSLRIINTDGLRISVDMSGDEPSITLINPDANLTAAENILVPVGNVIGTVEDDDAVNSSSIQIRFDPPAYDAVGGWLDIDSDNDGVPTEDGKITVSSPLFLRFEYPVALLSPGDHTLQVRAEDINGTFKITDLVSFSIDTGAPNVEIDSPSIGDYLNASNFTTISGTAVDGTLVNSVQVSLNGGTNWETVSITPAASVTWSYDVSDWPLSINDGPVPIRVKATDNIGKYSYANLQIILDTKPPTVDVTTPNRYSYVNGLVDIQVLPGDDTKLESVEYVVGQYAFLTSNLIWTDVPDLELYNFTIEVNTQSFEDPTNSLEDPPLSDVWKLPIRVRATDKAGNVYESDLTTVTPGYPKFPYFLYIDNSLDRPTVSIFNPTGGQNYGGSVIVTGTSFDDDGPVEKMEVRIDISTSDGTPEFDNTVDLGNQDPSFYIDFNGNGSMDPGEQSIDESVWHTISGKSTWSLDLNTFGELYDTDGPDSDGDGDDHSGAIYLEIRAADDPAEGTVYSDIYELDFRFDNTIPYIENLNYESNDYVGGNIVLTGDVKDNDQIDYIGISYNNGITYIPKKGTSDTLYMGTDVDGNDWWKLQVAIDTTSLIPTNGTLYLKLKVEDNNDPPYVVLQPISLSVDNSPPTIDSTAGYTGETLSLSGSSAALEGEMRDVGVVSGIDRVEVYLERGGMAYDPQSVYDYSTYKSVGAISMVNQSFDNGAGSLPHDAIYPSDPSAFIVIDNKYEDLSDSGANGDHDGFNERLSASLGIWSWGVEINSENIPDGTINVHYVIYDKGGNTAHYVEPIFLANNAPSISQLEVGTDLNRDGDSVDFGEVEFYSGAGTFTVRNNLFTVNPTVSGGNGTLGYELFYGSDDTGDLISTDAFAVVNDFVGAVLPNPINDGSDIPFYLRITDEVGLIVDRSVVVNLANNDSVAPISQMNPVTKDTIPNGGADGRVQGVGDSLIVYDGKDADISGTVTFSGYAYDEQLIQYVVATIAGYDGGNGVGLPFILISWDPSPDLGANPLLDDRGGLVPQVPGAVITYHSITETSGHQADWEFSWNSTDIVDIAKDDVLVEVSVYDFGDNTIGLPTIVTNGNSSVDANQDVNDLLIPFNRMTVDVMPFVTNLKYKIGTTYYNSIRTRNGLWPVPENADITIEGFNLNPDWIRIVKTGGDSGTLTDYTELDGAQIAVVDLTGPSRYQAATAKLNDGTNPIYHSGFLYLAVNGQPMMNHEDDNVLDQNKEGTATYPNWTDDRYLQIWEVGKEFTGTDTDSLNAAYAAMAMNPTNGQLFSSWTNHSRASVFTADDNDVNANQEYSSFDPPEYTDVAMNDDGRYYITFLGNFLGGTSWSSNGSGGLGLKSLRTDAGSTWSNGVDEVDPFYFDRMLWQFHNPRIAVNGTNGATDIYITYFDQEATALKFAHYREQGTEMYNLTYYPVTVGGNNDSGTNNSELVRDNPFLVETGPGGGTNAYGDVNILDDGDGSGGRSSAYFGTWSDVAVEPTVGVPVVLFSDTENGSVRLMRATSPNPTDHDFYNSLDLVTSGDNFAVDGGSNANDDAVFDWRSSQTIFSGGSYRNVGIAISPTGTMHVTAYEVSSGQLVYKTAPALNAAAINAGTAWSFGSEEVVDDNGNVGKWADLSLVNIDDDGAQDLTYPVISYFDSGWSGTFRGLKYAQKSSGIWDSGTVPLDVAIEDGRISVVGSLYQNLINPVTAPELDYIAGIGLHTNRYEYVRLRPELQ